MEMLSPKNNEQIALEITIIYEQLLDAIIASAGMKL